MLTSQIQSIQLISKILIKSPKIIKSGPLGLYNTGEIEAPPFLIFFFTFQKPSVTPLIINHPFYKRMSAFISLIYILKNIFT